MTDEDADLALDAQSWPKDMETVLESAWAKVGGALHQRFIIK
jgi:hypothetical protein